MNRGIHPLACLLPEMTESEYAELKSDIAEHGLREPILTVNGDVLDGRHRFKACVETGTEPKFKEWVGTVRQMQAMVVSLNLKRRHLTAGQRAVVATQVYDWLPNHRPSTSSQSANPAPSAGLSEAQMADLAGVSERTIRQAKKALRSGVADDVVAGKVSLKQAIKKPTVNPGTKSKSTSTAQSEKAIERLSSAVMTLIAMANEQTLGEAKRDQAASLAIQCVEQSLGKKKAIVWMLKRISDEIAEHPDLITDGAVEALTQLERATQCTNA